MAIACGVPCTPMLLNAVLTLRLRLVGGKAGAPAPMPSTLDSHPRLPDRSAGALATCIIKVESRSRQASAQHRWPVKPAYRCLKQPPVQDGRILESQQISLMWTACSRIFGFTSLPSTSSDAQISRWMGE